MSVKVYVRSRPLNDNEVAYREENALDPWVTIDDSKQLKLDWGVDQNELVNTNRTGTKKYTFDYVFDENQDQQAVYEKTMAPLVKRVVEGYNATFLAYGQTGSGKTFTMMGPGSMKSMATSDHGIMPQASQQLMTMLQEGKASGGIQGYSVRCGYIELYMNQIRDLMDPARDNLKVRQVGKKMIVKGMSFVKIESHVDICNVIMWGNKNRKVAATNMNNRSSRSHAILFIDVKQKAANGNTLNSLMYMVDLAGSENANQSGATGDILKQASSINKSLSTLSNVIHALVNKSAHVPYRDSELTKLLSNALGGNSLTSLIVCVSPSYKNALQTYSSLQFGQRAKKIKNRPKINRTMTMKEWQQRCKSLEEENKLLKSANAALKNRKDSTVIQDELDVALKRIEEMKEDRKTKSQPVYDTMKRVEKARRLSNVGKFDPVEVFLDSPRRVSFRRPSSVLTGSDVTIIDDDTYEQDDGQVVAPEWLDYKEFLETLDDEATQIEEEPIEPQVEEVAPDLLKILMEERSALQTDLRETLNQLMDRDQENTTLQEKIRNLRDDLFDHDHNISEGIKMHLEAMGTQVHEDAPMNKVDTKETSSSFGVPDDTANSVAFWIGLSTILILLIVWLGLRWNAEELLKRPGLKRTLWIATIAVGLIAVTLLFLGLAHVF